MSKDTTISPRLHGPPAIVVDVLVGLHPDLHVEVFGDGPPGVRFNVTIARFPQATSPQSDALAEDAFEQSLPPRSRRLYFANKLLASGTARPLLASVAHAALQAQVAVEALNGKRRRGQACA